MRTLGLSGFSKNEEQQFRQLFDSADVSGWALVAEADADALIIDFDSMYGQMSWLQAQNGSRPIVALTAGGRADATHVLQRPVSAFALIELLRKLSQDVAAVDVEETAADAEGFHSDEVPGATPARSATEDGFATETADTVHEPEPAPEPVRRLHHYLQAGLPPGPMRLADSEPPLVLDIAGNAYYGSAALKSLADDASRAIQSDEWLSLDAEQFAHWQGTLPQQPLSRLRWLAGLSAGSGELLAELRDAERFKLNKWPQAEREYPKLFRVATALLKQFATVDELAAASGVSTDEVRDFINACHAIGLIDVEKPAPMPAQATEGAARGGLLGRLRGKN